MNATHTSRIAALSLAAVLVTPMVPAQYAQGGYQASYPSDSQDGSQYADPPSRVARISVVNGNVSLEPAGVDAFSQAELNYPLTAGDRVYADNSSMSELQTDGLAVRLGNGADLTMSSLTDNVAQFGLAQGSIRLRTRDLNTPDGNAAVVEVDTPNGTIVVTQPGDLRVDSYPQDDTTVVTVNAGQAEITGPNLNTTLSQGQSLRLAGTNPVSTQYLRLLPADALDNFDLGRERDRDRGLQQTGQYVDPGMIGAGDLAQYGDWSPDPDYGSVWFPRAVNAGWTPYSNGHWAWVAPWGWTWIEAEPWGFAPFHYGRWASFGPPDRARWGWVPGPPPSVFAGARPPRPIYSPALVAFVGGPRFSLSVGFGAQPGAGVTAWFPLGPREAYQPWYHASPAYVNRVNVTNLYTRNAVDIRRVYNNRTTNVYNTNITQVNYINRPAATVAVAQRDFASGRGVAQSQHIRMDSNTQRQLAQAPILPHPLVTPQAGAAAPQSPARALPPNQNRPVVETRQGFERAGDPRAGARGNSNGSSGYNAGAASGNGNMNGTGNSYGRDGSARGNSSPQPGGAIAQPQPTVAPRLPGRINSIAAEPMPQSGTRGNFPQQRQQVLQAPSQPPITQAAPVAQQPQAGQYGSGSNRGNDRRSGDGRNPGQQSPVPAPSGNAVAPSTPSVAPQLPDRMRPPIGRAEPIRVPAQESVAPAPQGIPVRLPQQRSPDANRPLINRTEPQPQQPSFPQQQRAIQATDPGRPLGPQQSQNVRQGQPPGAATQPDTTSHPPAVTRPRPPERPVRDPNRPASSPQ